MSLSSTSPTLFILTCSHELTKALDAQLPSLALLAFTKKTLQFQLLTTIQQRPKDMCTMLFALHNDFSEGTTTITSDDFMVVLDSGCTCVISFDKHDFVGPIGPVQFIELKGIASGLSVQGVSQVQWTFLNEQGQHVCLQITCLYVPAAPT